MGSSMTSILIRIAAAAALVAALLYGWNRLTEHYVDQGRAQQKAVDQAAVQKLKDEATATLSAEKDKIIAGAAKLGTLIATLEEKRDAQQTAVAADLAARLAGPKLQFTTTKASGCGRSSPPPETATASAPSDPAPAAIQLPEPLNGNLFRYAADAQSLKVDYGILYEFVNDPNLVCALQ
jgi:septal ring factor EnvC (AmiA/AmiB activator)